MLGWVLDVKELAQPIPGGAIMQFNTALCLFLLGLGGMFLVGGYRRIALWTTFLPSLLGFVTVLEYLFSKNFGIDQLIVQATITHPTILPGRMAANTAIGFLLSGVAAVLIARFIRNARCLVVARVFCVTVVALSLISLIGHLFSLSPMPGWYGLTHMAPHTAIGLAIVSSSYLACSGIVMGQKAYTFRLHAPWMALAFGLVISFGVWQSVIADRAEKWVLFSNSEATTTAHRITYQWDSRVKAMERLEARWRRAGGLPESVWRSDAAEYVADIEGLLALAYCGPDGGIVWVAQSPSFDEGSLAAVRKTDTWKHAFDVVGSSAGTQLTRSFEEKSGIRYMLTVTPTAEEGVNSGAFVGVFGLDQTMISAISNTERGEFRFRLWENEAVAFASVPSWSPEDALPSAIVDVGISTLNWQIEAMPSMAYFQKVQSELGGAILFLGLIMTTALVWSLRERSTALRLAAENSATNEALSREILEREEVQQALARREAHINTLLQSTAEAIYGIDKEGRCTFCNRSCIRMLGFASEEDMLGKNVHQLIHHSLADGTAYPEETCRIYEAYLTDSGVHIDTEVFWRADGTSFPVEYWSHPVLRDGVVNGAVVTFLDISDRKAAQAALHASEERFDLAVRGANDGLWDWDIVSDVAWYSERFKTLLGYDEESELFRGYRELTDGAHPDDCEDLREALRKHLENYVPYDVECRLKTKDGAYRWYSLRGNCVRGADGSAIRMAGSLQDITERRSLMQEMNRLNQHLQEQGRDLALRNQEVEAFVYIVSHDLRAPLVNIQGFCYELEYSCEALEKLLAGSDLPDGAQAPFREIVLREVPDSLRFIKAGTARFEQLINALLRLSRTGRQTYTYDTIDMAAIVGEVVDSLAKNIEQVGASVVVSSLPAAVADRVAIGQVFSNLTVNALNYLRPDVAGQIEIGGELDGETGNPHFWVRDNGLGIPEAVRERVFQVFQRAHPEQCDGEGMGLAIVKRIVERHGGDIWVDSEVGHGSTFHFTVSQTHLEPSLNLSEEPAGYGA